MAIIRYLFSTLPIHLFMGGISLTLFLATLNDRTHSEAIKLSLFLFFFNIIGYLLLSSFLPKWFQAKEVLCSTFFFLGLGLCIWAISFLTLQLGNLYFLYHIVGYTSFIWIPYSFTNISEELGLKLGYLFSIIPSILIIFGFYVGKVHKGDSPAPL
ncbi:hypothetical protein [Aeribacillus pallidus]|jgi:hypothetical protein|uniref:hypothetical protein n=1 Tax=Aeribacillus pallidus TaxID=33936 RepID=UPI003D2398A2